MHDKMKQSDDVNVELTPVDVQILEDLYEQVAEDSDEEIDADDEETEDEDIDEDDDDDEDEE